MPDNDAMPIVGNSVHYYAGGFCRAAIVTGIPDTPAGEEGPVHLVVFPPPLESHFGVVETYPEVPRDETWDEAEGFVEGSWHWSGRG